MSQNIGRSTRLNLWKSNKHCCVLYKKAMAWLVVPHLSYAMPKNNQAMNQKGKGK